MEKKRTIYARTIYVDEDGVLLNKSDLKDIIFKRTERYTRRSQGVNGDRIINTTVVIKIYDTKQLKLFKS